LHSFSFETINYAFHIAWKCDFAFSVTHTVHYVEGQSKILPEGCPWGASEESDFLRSSSVSGENSLALMS